jgi:hypothetical protein
MRVTVYDVLSYLAAGMTHQEILDDFPYLTEADILACLSYAADRERHLSGSTGMKLLLDQSLSPRLVQRLADLYPDSSHVFLLGLIAPQIVRSGTLP